MTGREPDKHNNYYNPRVVWLLVVLVGLAVMVIGLSMLSNEEFPPADDEYEAANRVDSMGLPDSEFLEGEANWEDEQIAAEEIDDSTLWEDSAATAGTSFSNLEDLQFNQLPWWSFNDALDEVRGTDRFALIYFQGENCPPCEQMEKKVFRQEEIFLDLQYEFLPVKIEQASTQEVIFSGRQMRASGLADIFEIPGYPTLLFYDGRDSSFLFKLSGYTDSDKLRLTFQYLRSRLFENQSLSLKKYLSEQGYKSTSAP